MKPSKKPKPKKMPMKAPKDPEGAYKAGMVDMMKKRGLKGTGC